MTEELLPVTKEDRALNGYRAAVSFIGADAWDGCSDCMEILRAARTLDTGWEWAGDPDRIAQELKRVREASDVKSTRLSSPPQGTVGEVERVAKAMAESENPTRYWPGNEGRTYQSVGAGVLKCLGPLEPGECAQWRDRARAALAALSSREDVKNPCPICGGPSWSSGPTGPNPCSLECASGDRR